MKVRVANLIEILGKALIAMGLLFLGFIAYQIWGTGLETSRAQNKLRDQFEEIIAAPFEATLTTSTPPTPNGPTAVAAVPIPVKKAIALIEIPTIKVSQIVVKGVTTGILRHLRGAFRKPR